MSQTDPNHSPSMHRIQPQPTYRVDGRSSWSPRPPPEDAAAAAVATKVLEIDDGGATTKACTPNWSWSISAIVVASREDGRARGRRRRRGPLVAMAMVAGVETR